MESSPKRPWAVSKASKAWDWVVEFWEFFLVFMGYLPFQIKKSRDLTKGENRLLVYSFSWQSTLQFLQFQHGEPYARNKGAESATRLFSVRRRSSLPLYQRTILLSRRLSLPAMRALPAQKRSASIVRRSSSWEGREIPMPWVELSVGYWALNTRHP